MGAREQAKSRGLSDALLGSHTSVSCFAGSLCGRAATRLERALTAPGVDHYVRVHPGAGHGFSNHHDPTDRTLLRTFLNKVSGTPLPRAVRRRRASPYRRIFQPSPGDLTAVT
jgi:Dienelactone hydrolase family